MIDYEVTYKKVKHITLHIDRDGTLRVTAPYGLSKAAVEDAVARKAGWIAQHQEQTRQLMEERAQQGLCNRYEDGGEIAYLGKQYPLEVKDAGKRRWQWTGECLQLFGCTQKAHCCQLTEQFYRQQLSETILPDLDKQVRRQLESLSLPQPQFIVRKMRGSWGVCYSQQKKIVINLGLAMAPMACIHQVLVHEYLHFCQNNHSSEFYALLEHFEPQYRQLKHTLSVMVDLNTVSQ